jgi:hypothetical protein
VVQEVSAACRLPCIDFAFNGCRKYRLRVFFQLILHLVCAGGVSYVSFSWAQALFGGSRCKRICSPAPTICCWLHVDCHDGHMRCRLCHKQCCSIWVGVSVAGCVSFSVMCTCLCTSTCILCSFHANRHQVGYVLVLPLLFFDTLMHLCKWGFALCQSGCIDCRGTIATGQTCP